MSIPYTKYLLVNATTLFNGIFVLVHTILRGQCKIVVYFVKQKSARKTERIDEHTKMAECD